MRSVVLPNELKIYAPSEIEARTQEAADTERRIHEAEEESALKERELTAENIKKTIGSAAPLPEELEMEIKGRDLVAGIPKVLRISSVEVREALREPIMQIVEALKLALERCPPELAADIVDRGIVMTGGGSLLRELETLLKEETNLPINTVDDPLSCVVLGTGKILDDIEYYQKVLVSTTRD